MCWSLAQGPAEYHVILCERWELGVRYLDDDVLFGLIDRDLSQHNYDVSVIILTFQWALTNINIVSVRLIFFLAIYFPSQQSLIKFNGKFRVFEVR